MVSLIDKIKEAQLSRRSFLKASAVATSGLALVGCGNSLKDATAELPTTAEENGKWVTAACWHNCGGRCLNKALVVDGIVVRQKTDDTHEDTEDNPQQRACLRGRSQRFQANGADRLKYPMKRKNWQPGGGDKSLRGRDEWVRISWDEALDIVASEVTRIKDNYGTEAIFSSGNDPKSMLQKIGPITTQWGTASWGSWYAASQVLGIGESCIVTDSMNDRMDWRKSERVVAFGMNPAWSSLGTSSTYFLQMKQRGCEFIIFDPIYTDTIALLDAQWVPMRPGTDMAMQLALAHTMLTEDDPLTNPLIDWDYLNRCCVGFDAEHMPADARTNENFKDYLLGKYDGIAKTAEWASDICGVDANTIRQVARKMGKNVKLTLLTGWAPARTYSTDSLPQLFLTLGAMGGHIGQSGHNTGVSCWNHAANFGAALVRAGKNGAVPKIPYTGTIYPTKSINDSECWSAIVDTKKFNPSMIFPAISGKPADWQEAVKAYDLTKPAEQVDLNIQMIWHSSRANLQTREGMNKGIEAHRNVEFVVSQSHFLTTNSKYSDLVLPVTTMWEREAGGFPSGCNRDIIIAHSQIMEPIFEAKDDAWIVNEIGMRLGLPDASLNISGTQMFFNQIAGAQVIKVDGTGYENLVTITDADLANWKCTGTPQVGRIPMQKFVDDGIYQVERSENDNYGHIAFADFRREPEKFPLNSHTGKFEIYSQTWADIVNSQGFSKIDPLPKYIPAAIGYESTFANWETKEKGEYPYQLINPHYQRRSHSILDNIPYLREACPNPIFISAPDAKAKGIVDGDTVLITSKFGQTLRQAYVTERYAPGVLGLPHGAWSDIDEATGIDKAGADNMLSGNISVGQGVSAWNSGNVNFEKYSGAPLPADVDVPQRIIF